MAPSVTNPRRRITRQVLNASSCCYDERGNVFKHPVSPLGIAQYVSDRVERTLIGHGPDVTRRSFVIVLDLDGLGLASAERRTVTVHKTLVAVAYGFVTARTCK
jgi:hypothetical protein